MIAATFSASGLLAVIGLGLLAGTLIGCIGIGGVVLVPALAYLGGVPFPVAIAAAMMGYMLTGLVGTIVYARNASIRWPMALYLMGGAMPAALLGAWTSNRAPTALLETAIALLTLSSGAHAVWSRGSSDAGDRSLSPLPLSLIGAGTGFASALTGTGGPLVLVPTLLWLRLPVLTAIGLAQAIQLPIATLATIGNFRYGAPDIRLGAALAIGLAAGALIGARIAHVVPRQVLRTIVAIVLIAVGFMMIAKVAHRILP
ncbi:MAG: sulfite exporter TauE/SafE family protein [Hyphomicrobiaceae bacterium]|nr:sulfite exporter TauE/SafE family protein [Hyphomicrobiaceae bacterium]